MTRLGSIQEYMTWIPHAVEVGQSVADALGRMHGLNVHHMPVVEADRLVGMLAEGELARVSEVVGFDAQNVPVGDVMRSDVCSAALHVSLNAVVREMAARHADCCAVLDEGRVVGILTSTDVLCIFAALLEDAPMGRASMRPSHVRARILDEHALLREMLRELEQLAVRVRDEDGDAEAECLLRVRCRALDLTLSRHIELENALLAPALRQTDGFGPTRADQLLAEHASQCATLRAWRAQVDTIPAAELAIQVEQLIAALRKDMMHEDGALLDADLLRDDVIEVAATG